MPSFEELKKPFFARESTKRVIDELGHLAKLGLFLGSGVTVDRTGLQWDDLVVQLLTAAGLEDALARQLVTALGPRSAGSIAVQLFRDRHGDGWKLPMANQLRNVLYGKTQHHLGGRLCPAIAELWVEFESSGRKVPILTTNYDQHVELEIGRTLTVWNQVLAQAAAEESKVPPPLPEPESAVGHLHGVIPENDEVTEWPVVSERDYFDGRDATEKGLDQLFRKSNVLMIGSGLADPPVLNALLKSRSKAKNMELRRYAIVPRSDLRATEATKDAAEVIKAYESRLRHLGVEGIFIDHYSQAAQLLAEVRIASTMEPGEYPESDRRHGERLRSWWSRWYKQVNTPSKFRALQSEHHEALVACLDEVRGMFGAKDESLKLELWLRWQPADERMFRLWASSFSTFKDWKLARTAPISSESRYALVKAFCAGRPEYDVNTDPSERWRAFVAVPLEPAGEVNLVVGSIVVASMREPTESCLGEARRGDHAEMISTVRVLGARLAGVE